MSMFAPLQCIVGKHKGRYHIRVGSNFEQAPHGLLGGMFGNRPVPYVFHMWRLGGGVSPASEYVVRGLPTSTPYALGKLVLVNGGRTVAKDLYVNYAFSLPGPECNLYAPSAREWTHHASMLDWHHIIAPEGYRLPPGGMFIPADFRIFLKPPFDRHLWYEISFGCESSQVSRIVKTVSIDDITNAYAVFLGTDRGHEAGSRSPLSQKNTAILERADPARRGFKPMKQPGAEGKGSQAKVSSTGIFCPAYRGMGSTLMVCMSMGL